MLKVICLACLLEERPEPKEARSLDVCGTHYQQARRAGFLEEFPDGKPCPVCLAEKSAKIRPVRTRQRCHTHYQRARKAKELEPVYATRLPHGEVRLCKPCLKDGKYEKAKAHDMCAAHLGREYRGTSETNTGPIKEAKGPDCEFPGCGNVNHSDGLCGGHDRQRKLGRPLTPLRSRKSPGGPCQVTSHKCPLTAAHEGYCNTHYTRKRQGDPEWDRPIKAKAKNGTGHVDSNGYRVIQHNGRKRMEHCVIMEMQLLHRPLAGLENVHHVNGNRLDQSIDGPLVLKDGKLRSGNLELWSKKQPAGQEIGPKLDWAMEMQEEYAPYLTEDHLREMIEVLESRGYRVQQVA